MSTALVTGASRGIGRAIAKKLAATHDIVAVARSKDELDSLAKEIQGAGGKCRTIVCDLRDPAAIAKSLAGVEADVVVNNAGLGVLKPMHELTPDEWQRMIDVNINAIFHVTRAVLPGMMSRGKGHIVNIASITGRGSFSGGSVYSATKHFVMGLSESLMLEVRDKGVKVSVILPGSTRTDFSPKMQANAWAITADDVANAVAFVVATPPEVLVYQVEVRASRPAK